MQIKEPLWTSHEIKLAYNHMQADPWYADGIQLDSREVMPGDLFFALCGEHQDGHDYVRSAFAKGAVAAVVRQDFDDAALDSRPLIRVSDTYLALTELAKISRRRAPAKIIGVTGSAGKTSVVHMLRQAFDLFGESHVSMKSYNNHVGVPLSLARMPRGSRFGVFELGMNSPGEIDSLSRLVNPDIAVITMVGPAHLANFKSTEEIAAAKGEILFGLKPGGTAVIGVDHPYSSYLVDLAHSVGADTVTVSVRGSEADIKLVGDEQQDGGMLIHADISGKRLSFHMNLTGMAWKMNALIALGVTHITGCDVAEAAAGFGQIRAEPGRGRIHNLLFNPGEMVLVDDSYNANPVSMRMAFERLRLMVPADQGRKVVVLGDMRELGDKSEDLHLGLARDLAMTGAEIAYTLGEMSEKLAQLAGLKTVASVDVTAIAENLIAGMRHGDIVLVKGSNEIGLSGLVDKLISRSGPGIDRRMLAEGVAE